MNGHTYYIPVTCLKALRPAMYLAIGDHCTIEANSTGEYITEIVVVACIANNMHKYFKRMFF